MSFHFSTLRSAGLLWTRIEGSIHLNTLRKGEVDERFPGLLDAVLAAPKRVPPSRGLRAASTHRTTRQARRLANVSVRSRST
jgi:hypothetical protein